MREQYENFCEIYLNVCKKKEALDTTEQLKNRIKMANHFHDQLRGMVILMRACGEISREEETEQFDRLMREFSTIELFGAYIEDGEVYCFREVES